MSVKLLPTAAAAGVLVIAACAVNQTPPTTPSVASAAPTTPTTPSTPDTSTPTTPTTPTASATPTTTPTATASAEPVPPQPPLQEPPAPPPAKPAELKFSVADGRPTGLHEGVPISYWIWHDDHGKWWHVRSSTHTELHHFQGWAWHDKDRFTDVKPTRVEWADRIKYGAAGVSWDFHTKGHEDGFDFKTNGASCVRFALWIDGKAVTTQVHIGAGGVHPPSNHFRLCP
jgi:hypothetical protein